jgi:RNA-binding protein PNO1
MNIKEKRVELRSSKFTASNDALQMGADFVSAFAMGFDIDDAIALLRLDSLYIQSFDIRDVRQTLGQDALGRAIGRIAGKDGVCVTLDLSCMCVCGIKDRRLTARSLENEVRDREW